MVKKKGDLIEQMKRIKGRWLEKLSEDEIRALRNVEIGISFASAPTGIVTFPISPALAVALSFAMNSPIIYEFGGKFVHSIKEDAGHIKSAVKKLKDVI